MEGEMKRRRVWGGVPIRRQRDRESGETGTRGTQRPWPQYRVAHLRLPDEQESRVEGLEEGADSRGRHLFRPGSRVQLATV